ncbi:MAG: Trm112 family protein [Deltaproteobacteria bacterium]|nr:Trm112 family protein [Deltaproteobacteria bacterium]
MSLDPELRDLLVCPRCRGELREVERGLLCAECALTYPIVDGVPWMVEELARKALPAELGEPS